MEWIFDYEIMVYRTGALIVAALCVIGDGLSLLFSVFSHWESPVGDPIPFLGHLLKVLYMCLAVCLSVVGFIGARKVCGSLHHDDWFLDQLTSLFFDLAQCQAITDLHHLPHL